MSEPEANSQPCTSSWIACRWNTSIYVALGVRGSGQSDSELTEATHCPTLPYHARMKIGARRRNTQTLAFFGTLTEMHAQPRAGSKQSPLAINWHRQSKDPKVTLVSARKPCRAMTAAIAVRNSLGDIPMANGQLAAGRTDKTPKPRGSAGSEDPGKVYHPGLVIYSRV